jgi:hypothetical protein
MDMAAPTYEQILREAEALPREERQRLIEELAAHLRTEEAPTEPRLRWEDFAGTAPYPMCGEDAQAWVSRTRQESDDGRRIP